MLHYPMACAGLHASGGMCAHVSMCTGLEAAVIKGSSYLKLHAQPTALRGATSSGSWDAIVEAQSGRKTSNGGFVEPSTTPSTAYAMKHIALEALVRGCSCVRSWLAELVHQQCHAVHRKAAHAVGSWLLNMLPMLSARWSSGSACTQNHRMLAKLPYLPGSRPRCTPPERSSSTELPPSACASLCLYLPFDVKSKRAKIFQRCMCLLWSVVGGKLGASCASSHNQNQSTRDDCRLGVEQRLQNVLERLACAGTKPDCCCNLHAIPWTHTGICTYADQGPGVGS